MSILNKFPFLKKLPFLKNKGNGDGNTRKIVIKDGAPQRIVEGYNRLKDNVLYMNADGKVKVIQFESAVSGEGKTSVCCNLAVSLGLTDKKVVVVDLDFRKPKGHMIFECDKEVGISEYVLGSASLDDIIKTTPYKNVDLVTGGEKIHNSSLVLVSEKFKELIASLREKYDFVLLDCAPVLQISDYIHISKVSDGVLFIVAYAQTTKSQAADAIKELRRNNIKVLGSVFSMYDRKKEKGYSYKYYYYYGDQNKQDKE